MIIKKVIVPGFASISENTPATAAVSFPYSGGTIAGEKKLDSNSLQTPLFWDQESALEQRIYEKMKKWEIRHPIMGIVICTILGGILISLIAGIILEGIMMV